MKQNPKKLLFKLINFFNSKANAIPGKFAKHYEKARNNNKSFPRAAALSHNATIFFCI